MQKPPISLFSFPLNSADRAWIDYAANSKPFDPRVARAKLRSVLPLDFDPGRIDSRFYLNDEPTIFARRIFQPTYKPLADAELAAMEVQRRLLAEPGIDFITAKAIADGANLTIDETKAALRILQDLTQFASGWTDANPQRELQAGYYFTGSRGYDAALSFTTIDDLLDKSFRQRDHFPFGLSPGSVDTGTLTATGAAHKSVANLKPMTAFVIMPIDPTKPELEDVLATIKSVCETFNIKAFRADEIEHQDKITNIILEEIRDCEFLIADLSHERPNVYYEVGFAHALSKKPILYRRSGTKLHFDLSVHNVPEYRNLTELRELLDRRLEAILGRSAA